MKGYHEFRAWDGEKYHHDIIKKFQALAISKGNNPLYTDNWKFELCTGKKYPSGELMYEGDIVANFRDKRIRFVSWDDDGAGFKMREITILIPAARGFERISATEYPEENDWIKLGTLNQNPELIKLYD